MMWGKGSDFLTTDDYDLYIYNQYGQYVDYSIINQAATPIGMEACRFTVYPNERYYIYIYNHSATLQEILLLLGHENFPIFRHYNPDKTVNLASPAHNPNIITVGAVPYYDPSKIELFSSQGPTAEGLIKPDLVAPDYVSTASYGYNAFPGTSAAAPHVAGICALVKQLHPDWSPAQIKSYLEITAIDLGSPGKDNTYGSGLVHLPNPNAGADVETFVTRFYQQCLGRNPDTPGLNGWVNALINGTLCGADVANGFIFSQEFINRNTSNEDFVTILYRAFFGREPDTAGYNGWLGHLNSGVSRQAILNGFIYSIEFENLCKSYGISPECTQTTTVTTTTGSVTTTTVSVTTTTENDR